MRLVLRAFHLGQKKITKCFLLITTVVYHYLVEFKPRIEEGGKDQFSFKPFYINLALIRRCTQMLAA